MSCPVCFGGDDPIVRESLNAGIGVLLGVTGLVLAAFARFFVGLARRSRDAAHLVGLPTPDHRLPTPNVPPGSDRPARWALPGWELAPPGSEPTGGSRP